MKVVLLSTRRLPPSYFDTVRADLGGRDDLALDVVAWVPPAGPVDGLVNTFTLIGPGRMPVAEAPVVQAVPVVDAEEVPVAVAESAKAPAPEAVVDESAVESTATEADEVAEATEAADDAVAEGDEPVAAAEAINTAKPAPKPAAKPRPTGAKRVVKAVQWRARRLRRAGVKVLPTAIKKSAPMKKLTQNRKADTLAKTYWNRILGRADVMTTIDQADVVIALDGGSVWAGWQVGQRKPGTPVVLGLPAARRELDRMVGAGQE
ncbi:hypothetical protein [Kribbella sp. CA-293567]|uniref:hypothetical protein n=1 Tax=Kribbella sp. CA-293567 TaxID=3002436 RepID=UPI0022DE52EF|nr:hypothetical protein [Kribbella sp. CA-293567]WBQ05018.1 hypothetical protein OX958_34340 [Kribbella sp. CA-293567]